jgi:hypothetical protein
MGCKIQKKKILMVILVILMTFFATFAPMSRIVLAGSTDTLTIWFQFKANVSIDVSKASYNFTIVYAGGMKNTTATEFTIWNNGSTSNLAVDVEITTPPGGGLSIDEDSPPTATDAYALWGLKGTVDYQIWYKTSGWTRLHDALAKGPGNEKTFGLRLYAGNLSVNTSYLSMVITYRGS